MKIICWNCRGFGNLKTRFVFKNFYFSNRLDFVFLSEPRIDIRDISNSFWRSLDLKAFSVNSRNSMLPNIWGLCNVDLNPSVISVFDQQCSLSVRVDGQPIFVSAIYASTAHLKKRSLWNDLTTLQNNNPGPWCIIGDFNAVLGSHEVIGSSLPLKTSCDDFKAFIYIGNLIHLTIRGSNFTWGNGRRGLPHT